MSTLLLLYPGIYFQIEFVLKVLNQDDVEIEHYEESVVQMTVLVSNSNHCDEWNI